MKKPKKNFTVDFRSKCCNALVKLHGIPDFPGGEEICTISYVCKKCKNGCDVYELKTYRKLLNEIIAEIRKYHAFSKINKKSKKKKRGGKK